MFAVPIDFGIKAVKVRTKSKDGRVIRSCRVTLSHEFTEELAETFGKTGRGLLTRLKDKDIEQATVPIDALAAVGVFTIPGAPKASVRIKYMVGTKAKVKAGAKPEEPPSCTLEFDFAWQSDAWVFLGEHSGAIASVVLTQTQLALVGDDATN